MNLTSHLNQSAVIGSIRLQLRYPSGADKIWVIVEGKTDQKLFAKLLNGPKVTIG